MFKFKLLNLKSNNTNKDKHVVLEQALNPRTSRWMTVCHVHTSQTAVIVVSSCD